MRFEDYFKNKFTDEYDCIIGCEFKSVSQKRASLVKTDLRLVTNARCAIAKECNQSIISTKINTLRSKSFNPNIKRGDFLRGKELIVTNSRIDKEYIHQPDPLAKAKKRGKIHRVQLADISSQKDYSVGHIVYKAGFSQTVNLEHTARIEEVSKLE